MNRLRYLDNLLPLLNNKTLKKKCQKCTKCKKELNGFGDKVLVHIWLSSLRRESQDFNPGHVSLELMVIDSSTGNSLYKRGSYIENTYVSFWPADSIELMNTVKKTTHHNVKNFRDDLKAEARSPDLTFCFHSLSMKKIISRISELKASEIRYALFGKIAIGDESVHWRNTLEVLVNKILFYTVHYLLNKPAITIFGYRPLPMALPSATPESYSCVSMVFDVLNAGSNLTHLLDLTDKTITTANISRDESADASVASVDSIEGKEINVILSKVFKSLGYLTEASVSSIIISPDIFAEFMKQAKCNEMNMYNVPNMRKIFEKQNIEIDEWLPPSNVQAKKLGCLFFFCSFGIFIYVALYLIFKLL